MAKITIVGIGMDGYLTITHAAKNAINEAEILIGAERMLKPFERLGKELFCEYKSELIARYIRENIDKNIVVLMSGDCGFYSGAENLIDLMESEDIDIICGISSPVYFCSKIKMSWNDMHFVSLHGKTANIALPVRLHEKVFFLLGGEITASELCRRLCDYGLGEVEIFIGENMSQENERILSGRACDFTDVSTGRLCVAVTVNYNHELRRKFGIDDCEFIRDNIPMTKSEVRSVVMSKLCINDDDICWDIGCGSGSVSVEMAFQCGNGRVYAVDKNPLAVDLTRKNSLKFSCDNVEILTGNAVDIAETLPVPDRVFIGGSMGGLEKIVETAYNKNGRVIIVLTAVTLETLEKALDIFGKLELNTEITQIAVTRTHKVGGHTMLKAENPVFIIRTL